MQTPIADFVKQYTQRDSCRFHMPGHKGQTFLGCEPMDITEIAGADSLYEAEGIIAESENNASALFHSKKTLFSTEGSSQCIRAMLYLAVTYQKNYDNSSQMQHSIKSQTTIKSQSDLKLCSSSNCNTQKEAKNKPYIIAARNVHKAFLYATALLDFDIVWLWPKDKHSLCSCHISPIQLETELQLREQPPAAVYVTSPDYLGGQLAIKELADVCHKHHTFLLVDNAHGSYLHFLKEPIHPLDLGADICCDSAHKTLPVLTGGAYLQISKQAPDYFCDYAKHALALFGSTSPSYLTLTSLDLCNAYLADNYEKKLTDMAEKIKHTKKLLRENGWMIEETEPLKLTIHVPSKPDDHKLNEEFSGIESSEQLSDIEFTKQLSDMEFTKQLSDTEFTKQLSDTEFTKQLSDTEFTKQLSGTEFTKQLSDMEFPKLLSGIELAGYLRTQNIECEYADQEYVVFMITPENTKDELEHLVHVLGVAPSAYQNDSFDNILTSSIENTPCNNLQNTSVFHGTPLFPLKCTSRLSVREAIFAPQELIPAKNSFGRICGTPTVGCPPAVPIVVSGEEINEEAITLFEYYNIQTVSVVKNT